MTSDKNNDDDSQQPDDVEARIERLKAKASALSHGRMRSYVSPNVPPAIVEEFWKQVIATEEEDDERG
jgi:hypothetical protein